jgi:glutaconate CoA-transferase subunit B
MPPSTNEQRAARRANMLLSITDILLLQQRGYVDYGFLGGAQIDMYGNLNSSFIGDPEKPKVRLPGTGGANDIASLASKILVAMHHEKKRFVEKVDFITTPGYLQGGESRKKAGLLMGGTYKVITHLGIFGFEEKTKRMRLETLHPEVTIEEVKERTDFEMLIPEKIEYTKPPTEKELRSLRELDPDQRYTKPKEG